MKKSEKLTNIIESIAFVSGNPIAIRDIAEKLEVEEKEIVSAVKKTPAEIQRRLRVAAIDV